MTGSVSVTVTIVEVPSPGLVGTMTVTESAKATDVIVPAIRHANISANKITIKNLLFTNNNFVFIGFLLFSRPASISYDKARVALYYFLSNSDKFRFLFRIGREKGAPFSLFT